jgi:hypothetical protein
MRPARLARATWNTSFARTTAIGGSMPLLDLNGFKGTTQ